MSEAANIQ